MLMIDDDGGNFDALDDEYIVDGDDEDLGYALCLELLVAVDVLGDLGRAGACECSWDADLRDRVEFAHSFKAFEQRKMEREKKSMRRPLR